MAPLSHAAHAAEDAVLSFLVAVVGGALGAALLLLLVWLALARQMPAQRPRAPSVMGTAVSIPGYDSTFYGTTGLSRVESAVFAEYTGAHVFRDVEYFDSPACSAPPSPPPETLDLSECSDSEFQKETPMSEKERLSMLHDERVAFLQTEL